MVHQTVVTGIRGDFEGQTMVAIEGVAEGTQILTGGVGAVRAGTLVKTAQGGQ